MCRLVASSRLSLGPAMPRAGTRHCRIHPATTGTQSSPSLVSDGTNRHNIDVPAACSMAMP